MGRAAAGDDLREDRPAGERRLLTHREPGARLAKLLGGPGAHMVTPLSAVPLRSLTQTSTSLSLVQPSPGERVRRGRRSSVGNRRLCHAHIGRSAGSRPRIDATRNRGIGIVGSRSSGRSLSGNAIVAWVARWSAGEVVCNGRGGRFRRVRDRGSVAVLRAWEEAARVWVAGISGLGWFRPPWRSDASASPQSLMRRRPHDGRRPRL